MRTAHVILPLIFVAACAATPEIPPEVQAVRDYVEVGELEGTNRVRTHGSDAWAPLTAYYAVYTGRDGHFLLEFARMCRELTDNTRITPDRRYDHNVIRPGIDTLRGCRIDKIYPLTDAQAQELEVLVHGTGRGN